MLNEATAKPDDKALMGACSYHEFVSNDSQSSMNVMHWDTYLFNCSTIAHMLPQQFHQ